MIKVLRKSGNVAAMMPRDTATLQVRAHDAVLAPHKALTIAPTAGACRSSSGLSTPTGCVVVRDLGGAVGLLRPGI